MPNIVAGKLSLVLFSFLQCVVMMGILSSYIYSILIRHPPPLPFQNFQQFVDRIADGTLHVVTNLSPDGFYSNLQHWEGLDVELVSAALRRNPPLHVGTIARVLRYMDRPGAVVFTYVSGYIGVLKTKSNVSLHCNDSNLFGPSRGMG